MKISSYTKALILAVLAPPLALIYLYRFGYYKKIFTIGYSILWIISAIILSISFGNSIASVLVNNLIAILLISQFEGAGQKSFLFYINDVIRSPLRSKLTDVNHEELLPPRKFRIAALSQAFIVLFMLLLLCPLILIPQYFMIWVSVAFLTLCHLMLFAFSFARPDYFTTKKESG